MFAIRNKTTKLWHIGTDSREKPQVHRESNASAIMYANREDVEHQFAKRQCCPDVYEIVELQVKQEDNLQMKLAILHTEIEMYAMLAENSIREAQGHSLAYGEEAFMRLLDKLGGEQHGDVHNSSK